MTVTQLHPEDPGQPGSTRVPPQDLYAEQSVLGACMLSASVIDECIDAGLRGKDFYRPAHEIVWDAVRGLHDRREPVDAVTVAAELQRRGMLARIGGPVALHELLRSVPSASNAAYYAKIVRDRASLRGLAVAGAKIQEMGYGDVSGDASELVSQAASLVAEVADARHDARQVSISDIADRALEQIEQGTPATPTPWADLNGIIRGLKPGYLYATGARPGVGKTVVSLQWAVAFARQNRDGGPQAVYFTFEMTGERLYRRALATASGVSLQSMETGRLSDQEWRDIMAADGRLRELPIVFEGASGWTPQQVRARCRQLHRSRPVGLAVIDHIGLTQPERHRDSRQAEISEAADIALAMAHDLGSAVHIMTQLNRGVTQRSDQRPVPSDIRDSDRIEQNADVVMMLHRDKDRAPRELHIGVAKNRDGEENSCRLAFDGEHAKVTDWQWTPHGGDR